MSCRWMLTLALVVVPGRFGQGMDGAERNRDQDQGQAGEEKEDKIESDEAPPQEPPVQASLEDEAQKEGAWDTMTLILVGLAVVALLIYLFR